MIQNYQCYQCKGIFETGWTDEEARKEFEDKFGMSPRIEDGEDVLVCEDCYQVIMKKVM